MTSTARIEHVSNRIKGLAFHLFNGTSLTALTAMVYGGRTGIAGDVFVSFARDYGTNLAVISAALLFLVSLWGLMVVLYLVIAGIVAVVQGIRSPRSTPDMANPTSDTDRQHI